MSYSCHLLLLREAVRKTATPYRHDDVNYRALRQLLDGIDADIQGLIEASGDETANLAHRKLRDEYLIRMRVIDDPAVQAARDGRLGDVDKALSDVHTGPTSIAALKQVLGDGWDAFSQGLLKRLVDEYRGPDGVIDREGLTNRLSGMNPDVRQQIYGEQGTALIRDLNGFAETARRVDEAIPSLLQADNTKTARTVKKTLKRGILAAILRGRGL